MRAIGKSVDVCNHPIGRGAPVPLGRKGIEMRLLAIIVMLCMLPQLAVAQMAECKAITDADTRLACYDRIAKPTAATAKPAAAKPALRAAAPPKADGTDYVDSISSEDALMNARLRNICRGC
jgi:hypothetical protein